MLSKNGALPDHLLRDMIESGAIVNADLSRLSPASLDLTVSQEIYRLRGMIQPINGESVRDLLDHTSIGEHNLSSPMEIDVVYLARLNESFNLPNEFYGYCNPKSTTGRNDAHVRVITDGFSSFDSISRGYNAEAWALVVPKSIPIKMGKNEPITQVRLFNQDTRFGEAEIAVYMDRYNLLWNKDGSEIPYNDLRVSDHDGSIIMSVDLYSDIVGYRCVRSGNVLDLSKGKTSHNKNYFFEPIYKSDGWIFLKKGEFYILSTLEYLRIPPFFAAEMVPMDERRGDFRSHYAGFFDPGWGWGRNGEGKGRPITLEVRPFEDMILRHGQAIGKTKFERVIGEPETHYDKKETSNYKVQSGPRLSKHFK